MEKPQICFLQETKCNSTTLEMTLSKAWPGCQSVAVDVSGASGGLAIAWNSQTLTLSDFHASHCLIQAAFHIVGTNIHGNLSNSYFPQEAREKIALLHTLEALNSNRRHPLWIAGGDFNMITKLEEKIGGRNRAGKHQIASKLDRFLISDNSVHLGGDFLAVILPHSGSDHWPVALQWKCPGNNIRRPFHFEEFWFTHPSLKDFVHSTWTSFNPPEGSKMFQFQQKLKHLKLSLKRWNRETFRNIFKAQNDLQIALEDLQREISTGGHTERTLEQEQRIHNQLRRRKHEEIYWKKKSRIRWLKEQERNTKFFHRTTVQRRMGNNIPYIKKSGGERVEQHEEIEKEFLKHFKQVHQEPEINRHPAIERITHNVPKLITAEHNELLLSPI
eukprot:PITA_33177